MARRDKTLVRTFQNADLVLQVGPIAEGSTYDEGRYEQFLDALCGVREYQKEAIRTAVRYFLGGRYANLRALAKENYAASPVLTERYNSWPQMEAALQFPDLLSGTIDLATGTGKSYLMYGVAAILLAEGVIDSVLVLCPSTTIEKGLTDKFEELAANADLRALLPQGSKIIAPSIINASESIVTGTICIENFHAVLEHVNSSVRESLWGRGARTLVLNDEVHHVATEPGQTGKWKEFLANPAYGFRYVLGVSGTCYIGDSYFNDVIFRFSLRQAMESGFVKLVKYVADKDVAEINSKDDKWQLIRSNHEKIKAELSDKGITPLTIVVTPTINHAKSLTEYLRSFLMRKDMDNLSAQEAEDRVMCVYNNAPDVRRLPTVDRSGSRVEWIVAVSMLSEGWDVKRVFHIVPDEERAFNSKLLISQVLGRGLRIPQGWQGPQPVVKVFNHEAWTRKIKHLVDEVTESTNRISIKTVATSPYNFDLHSINYKKESTSVVKQGTDAPRTLFPKGYVDLATDTVEQTVHFELETATTKARSFDEHTIKRTTYTVWEVAERIHERLTEADEGEDEESEQPGAYRYTDEWTVEKLEEVVRTSLKRRDMELATDRVMQQFLAQLGSLRRGEKKVARITQSPDQFVKFNTSARPEDSISQIDVNQGQLKTFFYTDMTSTLIEEDQSVVFEAITEEGKGYQVIRVAEDCFKTPMIAAVGDSDPEGQFYKQLRVPGNQPLIDAWIKNTAQGFYDIAYYWHKGNAPKSGKFSPDFFLKVGDKIIVVEIKEDGEIDDPSPENLHKNKYAVEHFARLNEHLEAAGEPTRYFFHFLTPNNYGRFFETLRSGKISSFRSDLDVALDASLAAV